MAIVTPHGRTTSLGLGFLSLTTSPTRCFLIEGLDAGGDTTEREYPFRDRLGYFVGLAKPSPRALNPPIQFQCAFPPERARKKNPPILPPRPLVRPMVVNCRTAQRRCKAGSLPDRRCSKPID